MHIAVTSHNLSSALGVVVLFLLFPLITQAQGFEPGYVVSTTSDTLRGEIDDQEWVRAPESIQFRQPDGEVRTFTVENAVAFHVHDTTYERHTVSIDHRPTSFQGEPLPEKTFVDDTVFLQKVVEGPLTLYSYRDSRWHYYLLTDESRPVELTYYVQRVKRGGKVLEASSKDFQYQLADARTSACSNTSVERLDYDLNDLAAFVRTCNGNEGNDFSRSVADRTGFKLEHAAGLRLGSSGITHALNVPKSSVSSLGGAISYDALFSRNRTQPRVSFLAGLDLSYLSVDDVVSDLQNEVEACDGSECQRIQFLNQTDISTQAIILGLSFGARGRFGSGPLQPTIEARGQFSYPLSYEASLTRSNVQRYFQDGSSDPRVVTTEDPRSSSDPWDGIQLGARVGVGVQWNQVHVQALMVRGFRSLSLAGNHAPSSTQLGLATSFQF